MGKSKNKPSFTERLCVLAREVRHCLQVLVRGSWSPVDTSQSSEGA